MQKGGKKTYENGAIGIQQGGGNLWNRSSQSQKKEEKERKNGVNPTKMQLGNLLIHHFQLLRFPGPDSVFSADCFSPQSWGPPP